MDSPYQTISNLFGNGYWGESLLLVPRIFPGINSFGARRREANAWLAEEIRFLKIISPVIVQKLVFPKAPFLKEELTLSQKIESAFILFLLKW